VWLIALLLLQELSIIIIIPIVNMINASVVKFVPLPHCYQLHKIEKRMMFSMFCAIY